MPEAAVGIAAFVVALGFAAGDEIDAPGSDGARISLGVTMGSRITEAAGEFGYEFRNWELAATQHGYRHDQTTDEPVNIYSLSRVVRPDWTGNSWQPYFRIGAAYVDESPFVGDTNVRLGAGVEWGGQFSVEWSHYSSAGIHVPNTGVDIVQIRIHF